jgi:hypothetical protein
MAIGLPDTPPAKALAEKTKAEIEWKETSTAKYFYWFDFSDRWWITPNTGKIFIFWI